MPTAIIADDEDLQRGDLRRMLALAWPELEIVALCEDGADALEAIARLRPDIAFLDIRMPGASGLEVAGASGGSCRVVFTTAYDSHAIEAFGLGAIDYLLKPVTQERLVQTVARLRSQVGQGSAALLDAMAELDRRLRAPVAERIRWISTTAGSTIKLFAVDEVLFFESDSGYTRVVSAQDEGLIRTPLKELQAGLDPDMFWQIHRGTVVAVRAIARVRRDELGTLTVELRGHPEQLKVSQTYAWRFRGDGLVRREGAASR
ncbi:response regulator transcription factor [Massilia sp. Dwa41.01b]|uniref:LytR/AlgR family response regulator transcription factor n=1 Tax=unclassified Massilia TaxID=2609279 RepID=UPI0016028FBA|nr:MULTISPECIES: LytTR family DNA-binding domain-containing protein [unclassified Massilia]QNA87777.1 response regulator transcription factor [Massilia sp. Dwa41.01b]QNA98681.1 response regulator transcription factor [Massilia sp. Se16.2.3]